MIATTTIWEILSVGSVLLVGVLTGIFGAAKWLAERSKQDSLQREDRFDKLGEELADHGERLSTIEGKLDITPAAAQRRRAGIR